MGQAPDSRGSLAIALAVFALTFCLSRDVRADPPANASPVVVEYEADPSCPPVQFFFDQIRARTQRVREGREDEASIRLAVSVKLAAGAATGRLEVHGLDGSVNVREMTSRKCNELVDALALVAALSIDPKASIFPVLVPAPSPDAEETAPPTAPPPPSKPRARTAPPPRKRERVAWSAGAGGWILVNALPSTALGGRAWVQARADREGLWRPAGRFSLAGAAVLPVRLGPGEARFQLITARLDGCPLALRWRWLGFEPCVAVEGGVLLGQGVDVRTPKTAAAPWLTLGPIARVSAAVGSRVSFELEGGLVLPLVRPVMSFEESVVHEVPFWGLTFGAGATVQLL